MSVSSPNSNSCCPEMRAPEIPAAARRASRGFGGPFYVVLGIKTLFSSFCIPNPETTEVTSFCALLPPVRPAAPSLQAPGLRTRLSHCRSLQHLRIPPSPKHPGPQCTQLGLPGPPWREQTPRGRCWRCEGLGWSVGGRWASCRRCCGTRTGREHGPGVATQPGFGVPKQGLITQTPGWSHGRPLS